MMSTLRKIVFITQLAARSLEEDLCFQSILGSGRGRAVSLRHCVQLESGVHVETEANCACSVQHLVDVVLAGVLLARVEVEAGELDMGLAESVLALITLEFDHPFILIASLDVLEVNDGVGVL